MIKGVGSTTSVIVMKSRGKPYTDFDYLITRGIFMSVLVLKTALEQLPTEPAIHSFIPGFDIVVHVQNADQVEAGTLWDVKDLRQQTIYRIRRVPGGLQVEITKASDLKTAIHPLTSNTVWDAVLEIMESYIY